MAGRPDWVGRNDLSYQLGLDIEVGTYCMKPRWTWAPLGIGDTLADRSASPVIVVYRRELTRRKELVTVVGRKELFLVGVLSKENVCRLNSSSLRVSLMSVYGLTAISLVFSDCLSPLQYATIAFISILLAGWRTTEYLFRSSSLPDSSRMTSILVYLVSFAL